MRSMDARAHLYQTSLNNVTLNNVTCECRAENIMDEGEKCLSPVFSSFLLTLYQMAKFYISSKFKELTHKINATKKLKFVLGIDENILGKGENAGY